MLDGSLLLTSALAIRGAGYFAHIARTIVLLLVIQGLVSGCSQTTNAEIVAICHDSEADSLGYIDEWYSIERPIPHGSEIKIHRSGQFEYVVGACMFHGLGSGQWWLSNDTLILLSDSIHGCFWLCDFDANHSIDLPVDHMERWEERTSLWSRADTCEGIDPLEALVIFNEERFVLNQDTLRHVSRILNQDVRGAEVFARTPKP